jgi:diguanylate cyclase (GGDEF)-like protein
LRGDFLNFAGRFVSLLIVVWVSLTFPSDAQAIDMANMDGRMNIGHQAMVAKDVPTAITITDILSPTSDVAFVKTHAKAFQASSRKGDVWMRAQLHNSTATDLHGDLVVRFPYLQRVDVYLLDGEGYMQTGTAGSGVALSGIALPAPFPTFEIDVPAGETRTVYIRANGGPMVVMPVWFHTSADYQAWFQGSVSFFALLMGIACTFTAYAWSIARKSDTVAYRLYFWFCVTAITYVIFSTGMGKSLFWSHSNVSTITLVYILQGTVTAFGAMFISNFLDIRRTWPAFYIVINGLVALCVLGSIGGFFPSLLSRAVYMICSGIGPIVVLVGVWVMHRRRVPGAGAVLIGWAPLIVATVWLYLRLFEITPYFEINHYVVPLGLCFTVFQFSWAISNRVKDAEASAATDPLTGLSNRRDLETTLAALTRSNTPACTAVLAIDLDGFKAINDTHGHDAGDLVLQVIASRLKNVGASRAKPFRTGGDEFLIVYSNRDARAEIQQFGAQCITVINRPIAFRGTLLTVGASVGVAFIDDHVDFRESISRADAALYAAKREGKGIVRLFDQRQSPIGQPGFKPIVVNA